MKLDGRLGHAFSDLEMRVNQQLETKRPVVPVPAGPQRSWRRYAGPVLAAAVVGAAVVVGTWLFQPPGDSVEPASSTSPTIPTGIESSPTTVPGTGPSSIDGQDGLPAIDTAVVITAGPDGVVAHDWNRSITLVAQPAVAAHSDLAGGVVYVLESEPQTLRHWRAGAADSVTPLTVAVDESLELLGTYQWGSSVVAAYTTTTGQEDSRLEQLNLIDLASGTVTLLDEPGGGETGLMSLSLSGDTWVIQAGGEGIMFTRGVVSGRGEVPLAGVPQVECAISGGTSPRCHWYTSITSDGRRYVSILWNGDQNDPADLVVTNAATGEEERRIALEPFLPIGLDVSAYPQVVINTLDLATGQSGVALAGNIEESDPPLAPVPLAGQASGRSR